MGNRLDRACKKRIQLEIKTWKFIIWGFSYQSITDTAYFYNQALKPRVSKSIKINSEHLGEYLNGLAIFRFVVMSNMRLQEMIKKQAENLLSVMKNEYDVK